MSDIRIKIFEGSYSNEDAYVNVLNYIMNKYSWGGYGFWPYDPETIITAFEESKSHSAQHTLRNLWHFTITFSSTLDLQRLYTHANEIALLFVSKYQVLFAVDIEGRPHLHFAVNSYSYYPNIPVLSDTGMESYIKQILYYFHQIYPKRKTTFYFKKEAN